MPNTTVTNPSVSESDKTNLNPSDEGKSPSKEVENKIREQLRAEYARKEEALSEKLEETEGRLAELDEKVRLSETEKAEQKRLQRNVNSLEEQLRIFETDPQFDAAREHINKRVSQTKDEAVTEALKKLYTEQVDDLIEEESEKRGIDPKQFRKDLNKLLRAEHMEMNPLKRTKAALKEFDKIQKDVKEKEEFEKKKLELDQFSETGERIPRGTTIEEAKKSGDMTTEAALRGL